MAESKLERLLTLTNVLMATSRHLSAVEIRHRVPGYPAAEESFRRAFERDKAELRGLGVALDLGTVPGSDPPVAGYRILARDCTLRDPGLTGDELEALRLAVAVIGSTDGAGQRALHKLGGGATPGAPRTELAADPALEAAFRGVAERRRLRFSYHDEERTVDPFRLQFARDRWYLLGHDHLRGEMRWYRLQRVDGEIALDDEVGAFDRPEGETPGLQLAPWLVGGRPEQAVEAQVWFDPAIAAIVRPELADATIEADDEEGLIARVPVTNREGFRAWMLSYLERAEVLGPAELRDEIVAWLVEVAG